MLGPTWYLALNRARLPESKEDTIARYRARSRRTASTRRLVGAAARALPRRHGRVFAWEKAVGDDAELEWWERGRGGRRVAVRAVR